VPLDILTFGEALVEIMRTEVGQPLDQPGPFIGPYPSGAPFIFAAQAARLGLQVGAIGCVGSAADGGPDAFGRALLAQMTADGINTRGMHTAAGHATGAAFVSYNADGTRDFVFHAPHAAAGQLTPAMLDPALFDGLRALHIMGSSLAIGAHALAVGERALALAQAAGALISFDPNLRPQLISPEQAREAFRPFLDAAHFILPTAEEALLITGEAAADSAAARLLAGAHARAVVLTHGAHGCTVYTRDALHTRDALPIAVPAFPADEIDPTGAGDCFDAGFLVSVLRGLSFAEAARFGCACGALAVGRRGPMAGARPAAEVEALLSAHPS
jgi:sugar/nucleoside kinase (ribokinase family)